MAVDAQAGKPRIDFSRYELTLGGTRARLERQPMELLIFFVQRKGQLVTRADIVQKLWGQDVFIEVDASINRAVRKIRAALRDDPESPRYLETVVGKGYRFIGDIELTGAAPTTAEQGNLAPPEPAPVPQVARHRQRALLWIAALVLLAGLSWAWMRWHGTGSQAQIRSIAVLPLTNLSGDPAQEYFADGMTDELITEMAQIGSMRVISRTSSMHYKATAKTVPEIARELNVDAVLEGSVSRSGGRVRITAQLIQAHSDTHLWAKSYEADSRDVLGMQDAVARDVIAQIRLRLTSQQQERLSRTRPVNVEAHEAYLKGLYNWNKRDKAGLETAIHYFNSAIAIDPNYALPYAALAESYIPLSYFGYMRGTDARVKVTAAAEKALELDDSLAEAHTALGSAKSFYDYDWEGAEKEFRRAIELNPNYATAHAWYGQMLGSEDRQEEALAEGRRAIQLDPLSLINSQGWGLRLYRARRYKEAQDYLSHDALELDPNFPSTHWTLGLAYSQQKKFEGAIRELQTALDLFHDENALVLGGLGYAYAASGDKARAREILRRLKQQASQKYVAPYAFVLVYAGLGDKDRAFEWLDKAFADRDCWITFVNVEPLLDGLRSDSRFTQDLRRIGLAH